MTTVGFYVKAGVETGYGHIVRCLALADELRERGVYCRFWGNEEAMTRALESGYTPCPSEDYKTHAWIVDLEGGCPPSLARRMSEYSSVIILNGVGYPDGDPGRLLADLVFYQGVTRRPYELDWTGFEGEWFEGPDWLILRREFSQVKARPGSHDPPRIVVAGGGSDPRNVTGKVLNALKDEAIEMRAIVGPANSWVESDIHFQTLDMNLNPVGSSYEVLHDPPNMAETLAWSDVAVVSYGMTVFECLALGLPTVALSISEDHATSANLVQFQSNSALVSLGSVENVPTKAIREAVYRQLTTPIHTSKLARQCVDGKGAGRVADKIMEVLSDKLGMGQ
jgi:spore coat polysaccharide biosynthesis protein SpsF